MRIQMYTARMHAEAARIRPKSARAQIKFRANTSRYHKYTNEALVYVVNRIPQTKIRRISRARLFPLKETKPTE